MNIVITYDSEKPLYEQVAESITHAIYNKELENNELLPSVRQLATDLNVSSITTKRAYAELERQGMVYTVPGKGTFVKVHDLQAIQEERKNKILQEIEANIQKGLKASVKKEELQQLIDKIYENNT